MNNEREVTQEWRLVFEVGMKPILPQPADRVKMCTGKLDGGTCPNRTFAGEDLCYPHFLGLPQTSGGLVILPKYYKNWEAH